MLAQVMFSLPGLALAWGDERGLEGRSRKPSAPCALKRSTHLVTVFGVVLNGHAAAVFVSPPPPLHEPSALDLLVSGGHSWWLSIGPPRIAGLWQQSAVPVSSE